MLDHFADIDALDLDGVEPMTQPYPLVNVLRDDVVGACLDRDEVLAEAPAGRATVASGCRPSSARRRDRAVEIAAAVRAGQPLGASTSSRSTSPASPSATASSTPSTSCWPTRRGRPRQPSTTTGRRRATTPVRWPACPIALKDNLCTRGIPTTCSSRILEGGGRRTTPPSSSASAPPAPSSIGKTNLDEFAMGSSTENSAFGPDAQPARPDPGAGRLVGRQRGRRWPPASRRSASAPTPAARSASRRRCAASSA